jgi:uncharacterized membrane protein YbaN (DUF454 family)
MEIKRLFFLSLGGTCLAIGAVGLFVPLLPTTPLILASFVCFTKSSKRAERWISSNRYFGSFIENYQKKTGVPWDVKIKSIILLWMVLSISMFIFSNYYLFIVMCLVGVAVTAHIISLKTKYNI